MSVMATPHFYAVYSVFVFVQYICTYVRIAAYIAALLHHLGRAHAGKDKDKERATVSVTAAPHPTPSPAGFVDGLSFSRCHVPRSPICTTEKTP